MHENDSSPPPVPQIESEVITTFLAEEHNLEELYKFLKKHDPHLAGFLMRRAEQLAPRDIEHKRALAQLALEMYGIQYVQGEVDTLRKEHPELFADAPESDHDAA